MKATPDRRVEREVRLVAPDARSRAVRRRVAIQVARLNPVSEKVATNWIEAVSKTPT